MGVTVVVGGQFGSEGKGKLVAHLAAAAQGPVAAVRCGGTNSGHTIELPSGRPYALRQLPAASLVPGAGLYLGAGMIVDPALLRREMLDLGIPRNRVRVDRNAVILDQRDVEVETGVHLRQRLGSTLSGTGSATARKVLRDPTQKTARSCLELMDMVDDVSLRLNEAVDRGIEVIVEGTQGAGLSLHHSPHHPFTTSRDTTAAAFLSEVGLAPTLVSSVIVVFRTFPIRVAGNSGPLENEVTWGEVTRRSRAPVGLTEFTTVTGVERRVAEFDWVQARDAVRLNRPTALAIHGLDYLNFKNRGARRWSSLSAESRGFIEQVESRLSVPVRYVFTGPSVVDVIERSGHGESASLASITTAAV